MGFRKSTSFYNDLILQKQIPASSMDSMSDTVSWCQRYKNGVDKKKCFVIVNILSILTVGPESGFILNFPARIFSLRLCHCTRMYCALPCPLIILDESSSSSKTVCHEGLVPPRHNVVSMELLERRVCIILFSTLLGPKPLKESYVLYKCWSYF